MPFYVLILTIFSFDLCHLTSLPLKHGFVGINRDNLESRRQAGVDD